MESPLKSKKMHVNTNIEQDSIFACCDKVVRFRMFIIILLFEENELIAVLRTMLPPQIPLIKIIKDYLDVVNVGDIKQLFINKSSDNHRPSVISRDSGMLHAYVWKRFLYYRAPI